MTAAERIALREAAERATKGPWAWESVGEKSNSWCLGTTEPPVSGEIVEQYDEEKRVFLPKPEVVDFVCESVDGTGFADARFIAAASPSVVLALLDEIDRVEAWAEAADELLSRLVPRCCFDVLGNDYCGGPCQFCGKPATRSERAQRGSIIVWMCDEHAPDGEDVNDARIVRAWFAARAAAGRAP